MDTRVVHLNIPGLFLAGSVYLPNDEVADGAQITLTDGGETRRTQTNYFGDFEFEDLKPGIAYEVLIEYPGYQSVRCTYKVDKDHFLGEFVLEAEE